MANLSSPYYNWIVNLLHEVLYGFFFSFTLEFCQYVLAVGASDITDLTTNTLSAFGGVCVYGFLEKLFCNKAKLGRGIHILSFITLSLFLLIAILLFLTNR